MNLGRSLLLLSFITALTGNIAAQEIMWSKQLGGKQEDAINSLATDKNGNVYACGYFTHSAIFDDKILNAHGASNGFLVKYNADGYPVWLLEVGSKFWDNALQVVADEQGGLYVVARTEGELFIAGKEYKFPGENLLTVIKFNTDGKVQWVKASSGETAFFLEKAAAAVDKSGNLYITGSYEGRASFGDLTIEAKGNQDIYVVKYGADGKIHWLRSMGGLDGDESGNGIAIDKKGDVYICGTYSRRAYFGEKTIQSMGAKDIFVARLSDRSELQWVQTYGTENDDYGHKIAVDRKGNMYITAQINHSMMIGSDTLYTSSGKGSSTLIKINSKGIMEWGKQLGSGMDIENFGDVAVDKKDDIYFFSTLNAGTKVEGAMLETAGKGDLALVKYDERGKKIWMLSTGYRTDELAGAMSVNQSGEIFVSGTFDEHAQAGNMAYGTRGKMDAILIKIKQP